MPINRIDHAAIRVADLGEALNWYEDVLGLTLLDRNDERALLSCSGDAADLTVVAGGQSLVSFAFGVDSQDDLDEIVARLERNEIAYERYREPDRPGHDEIIGFMLPSGQRMEFAVAAGERVAGRTEMKSDGSFRPTDIDHINLLGEVDPSVMREFLTLVLGFKHTMTLAVGGATAATWCRTTQVDHDIAYMRAINPSDRLHHVAFNVEDGNHFFRLSDQLFMTGHEWEFGPGRHVYLEGDLRDGLRNNFAYAFDPTGNRNEFCAGMRLVADEGPGDFPDVAPEHLGRMMNGWAPNMPESFLTVGS